MAKLIKHYHTCGTIIHIGSYWNGLDHVPIFHDAVGIEVDHCPHCGEWLSKEVLFSHPPEREDSDIVAQLLEALENLLHTYIRELERGAARGFNPEETLIVKQARAAIKAARGDDKCYTAG